jgi:hypothetical protein
VSFFEVPAAVVMKSSVFWDITLCSPLKFNRYEEHIVSKFRLEDVLGLFFDSED